METREQTAIRLLKDLVSLQNGAPLERDRETYESTMREIDEFLNSPAQFDTLQEGDYVVNLSFDDFEKILDIENDSCRLDWEEGTGLSYNGICLVTNDWELAPLITQLTPEEFLRRADNTFKTK